MYVKIAFILIYFCSFIYAHSEERIDVGSRAFQESEVFRIYSKGISKFFKSRIEFKEKNIKTVVDLKNNLARKDDQSLIDSVLKESGNFNLAKGEITGRGYVVDLGNAKLSITEEDIFNGTIHVNNKLLDPRDCKNLSEIFQKIDHLIEEKTVYSYPRQIFSMLVESSYAADLKFKNILKINAAGVIYLTMNSMAFWRNDRKDFAELIDLLNRDSSLATRQCLEQSKEVSRNDDTVKVYSILNSGTRKALMQISDLATNRISEDRVLASLLKKYATLDEHNNNESKSKSCREFLSKFVNYTNPMSEEVSSVCANMSELTACLDSLYSKDKEVVQAARKNNPILKYGGEVLDSDVNKIRALGTSK